MISRALRRVVFTIERWIVRGPHIRFLVVAAVVGLLSLGGGIAVRLFGDGFAGYPEAVWWSFLRLTDPGYLGDDEGMVNRVVSTVLTLAGYVVFLGALVAIMTQWLQARMAQLESGLTPLARSRHVVILGWTTRTPAIVRELLFSQERVHRFLQRRGARQLQIVILAEEVSASSVQDLRDSVGEPWEELRVTVRSGSPLRPEHLARVDTAHAAAVIIPGAEFEGGIPQADTETIKTLLSLERLPEADGRPLVVAEIFQERRAVIARKVYRGDREVICSGLLISRLLAQNLRYPGLSGVFNELLTRETGNAVFLRDDHGMEGLPFGEIRGRFDAAIPLGIVRRSPEGFLPRMNPDSDFRIEAGDSLAFLARSYRDTNPKEGSWRRSGSGAEKRGGDPQGNGTIGGQDGVERAPEERSHPRSLPAPEGLPGPRRVLILGWNHKGPSLLEELAAHEEERFRVTVASRLPLDIRKRELKHGTPALRSLDVHHVEADITDPAEVDLLDPKSFPTILILGSDRTDSEGPADARTLMAMLVLRELLADCPEPPTVILELLDAGNVELMGNESAEIIVSPLILSHLLAQVALRPELNVIFDELFGAGGVDIAFHPAGALAPGGPIRFDELAGAAARGKLTALGVRERRSGRILLNPSGQCSWGDVADLDLVTLRDGPPRRSPAATVPDGGTTVGVDPS